MTKSRPSCLSCITRPVESFDPDVQDTKKPALELLKVDWPVKRDLKVMMTWTWTNGAAVFLFSYFSHFEFVVTNTKIKTSKTSQLRVGQSTNLNLNLVVGCWTLWLAWIGSAQERWASVSVWVAWNLNIWAIRENIKVEEFCSRSKFSLIYYILYSAARGMSLQIGDSHRDDGETGNEPALGRRIFSQVFFNQLEVATYPGQVKKWRIRS